MTDKTDDIPAIGENTPATGQPAKSPLKIGGFALLLALSGALIYYVLFYDKTPVSEIDKLNTQSQVEAEEQITQQDRIDSISADRMQQQPKSEPEDPLIDIRSIDLPDEHAPLSEAEQQRIARLQARKKSPGAIYPGTRTGSRNQTSNDSGTNALDDLYRQLEDTAAVDPIQKTTLDVPELRNDPATASYISDTRFTVFEGTMIPITIETAINSDHPGRIRGITNQPVYAADGNLELLPRFTKLYGEYQSGVNNGQLRVFIMWNRLITPNNINVNLDSPGTDTLGRAGMPARRNSHFIRRFGSSVLLSIIGGLSQSESSNENQRIYFSENFNDAATIALQNSINIPPTLTTRPGMRSIVYVNRDLHFKRAYTDMMRAKLRQARKQPLIKTVYNTRRPDPTPTVIASEQLDTVAAKPTPAATDPCHELTLPTRALLSNSIRAYIDTCDDEDRAVHWKLGAPGQYTDFRIKSTYTLALPNKTIDLFEHLKQRYGITTQIETEIITFHD